MLLLTRKRWRIVLRTKKNSAPSKSRSSRTHHLAFQLLSVARLSYNLRSTRQLNWTIRLCLKSNRDWQTLYMSVNKQNKSILRIKSWLNETLKLRESIRTRSTCLKQRFRRRNRLEIGSVNVTRSRRKRTGGKCSTQTVFTEPMRSVSIRCPGLKSRQPLRASLWLRRKELISWLRRLRRESRSVISLAEGEHSTMTRMSRLSTNVTDTSTISWSAIIRSTLQRSSLISKEAQPFDKFSTKLCSITSYISQKYYTMICVCFI